MPRPVWLDALASFDQNRISLITKAADRAWSVIRYTDNTEPEEDARKILALCVMSEVRTGEEYHLVLVNRAVIKFRTERARLMALSKLRRRLEPSTLGDVSKVPHGTITESTR
jgi:hypothetical protein